MAEIEKVRIELLFPQSAWNWKERLLDAFEQQPKLAPTHWGESEHLRQVYVREQLVRFVDEVRTKDLPTLPSLRRVKTPRYVATWSLGEKGAGWLFVFSQMRLLPEDPALLFGFAEQLAGVLPVEYGLVDLQFKDAPAEWSINRGALQHSDTYLANGPNTLFPRTFLGPRLVALMGGEQVLRASGGRVQPCGNGVVRMDLLDAPWTATPQVLKERQTELLEKLRPTGVFARQEGRFSQPGERWTPPIAG
ncbi:hypothetical protein ACN469_02920 [Corallococcus terminator]